MNLRWLRVGLRVAGLILIVCGAVIFVSDSASLRTETQTTDGFQIHHTVALSQTAIIFNVVGVVLFATSLFIRSK